MTENREKLLRLPVCKWKQQLDEWRSHGLGGIRHNEAFSHYIQELQEINWKIYDKTARALRRGPSELVSETFDSEGLKPDNM